jgi:hypothetical protein
MDWLQRFSGASLGASLVQCGVLTFWWLRERDLNLLPKGWVWYCLCSAWLLLVIPQIQGGFNFIHSIGYLVSSIIV